MLKRSCRADGDPSLRPELSGRERESLPGGPAWPRHRPAHPSGGCRCSAASDLPNGNVIQSNLRLKHGNVLGNLPYDDFFFIFIITLRSSQSKTVLLLGRGSRCAGVQFPGAIWVFRWWCFTEERLKMFGTCM